MAARPHTDPRHPTNGAAEADAIAHGDGRATRRQHRAVRRRLSALHVAEQREDAARATAAAATDEAEFAQAEYEAELQSVDPDGKRRGSLPFAVLAALLFALADIIPAWWAAEALGGGWFQTALVTGLLVAGLAGFAALLSYFQHERRRTSMKFAFGAAATLVVVESLLRLDYLLTTGDEGLRRALTEAGLLALVTAGLLWMSYVVLLRAESVSMWRMRRETSRLADQAAVLRDEATRATTQRWNEEAALDLVNSGQSAGLPDLFDRLKARIAEMVAARRGRGAAAAPAEPQAREDDTSPPQGPTGPHDDAPQ